MGYGTAQLAGPRKHQSQPGSSWSGWGPVFPVLLVCVTLLLGPAAVVSVAGRAPNVWWVDLAVLALGTLAVIRSSLRFAVGRPPFPPSLWFYIAFLVIATISVAWAKDILVTAVAWKVRVMPLLVFLIVYQAVRGLESAKRVSKIIGLTGIGVALLTLLNWNDIAAGGTATYKSLVTSSKDFAQTSFGTSNYIATILVFCLPWCAVPLFRSRILNHVFTIAAISIMSWGLLLTQSRGAFLSVLVAAVLFAVQAVYSRLGFRRLMPIVTGSLVVAGAAYGSWLVAPPKVASELSARFDRMILDVNGGLWASNRTATWEPAVKGILSDPVLGIGLGNQGVLADRMGMQGGSAHNVVLEAALELGIGGTVPLAVFLVLCWRQWYRVMSSRSPETGRIGLIGMFSFQASVVHCLVEPSFWGPQFAYLFWGALGVAFALDRPQAAPSSVPRTSGWVLARARARV